MENKQNTTNKYEEMKTNIINDIVVPNLEHDAKILSIWRIRWRKIANLFETLVKILVGISTVLAYSSGYYHMPSLAYYSGLAGTIALVFGEFSSYCKKESHERTNLFNRLLTHLGIDTIPDTTEDETNVPSNEYGTSNNPNNPNNPNKTDNLNHNNLLEMTKIIREGNELSGSNKSESKNDV